MAEQAQKEDKDPSVEEILQSIRRIIAEDGDAATPAPANTDVPAQPVAQAAAVPAAAGSDVLELTDIVKDDGTVVNIKTRMPQQPAADKTPAMDVLSNIDDALFIHEKKPAVVEAPPPPVKEAAVEPMLVAEEQMVEEEKVQAMPKALDIPPIALPAVEAMPVMKDALPEGDLVSEQTVVASAETFRNFAEAATRESVAVKEKEKTMPSPVFRSGDTVEDLVVETLRPMLKEWLDKNLPTLVQKVVEKEIRRIANTAIND